MKRAAKFLLPIGCVLIAASLGLLLFLQVQTRQAQETNLRMVRTLESLLPEPWPGLAGAYSNTEMPILELEGEDLLALLEVPAYGVRLPVAAHWDKGTAACRPCRFWGSAYDQSLIVGGSDRPGQFDFFDRIETGAAVTVTDMTGCRFAYVVERVERSASAEAEILLAGDTDLTLFVRDARLGEYILLRCAAD